jgi:alkyl sulfatase BDS1-like metallo-beta-lactamase superfamily hydrolase
MASRDPELLLPGHGPPIVGADRVRQALDDTAAYLEALERQSLALMNQGASLDQLLAEVGPPPELLDRPYLQPVYDEPEFIVRNIWRLYGGWYDGQPSHLKPASEAAQASEIAALAGGVASLLARASELADAGELRLACHLADWAHHAAPDDPEVRATRGRIYLQRAAAERSTMAVGIFRATARDMGVTLEDEPTFRSQQRSRGGA